MSRISFSDTNAFCSRTGLDAPIGRNSASPWPTSFSAPGWSRMTRESIRLEVEKASRDGTLALISPVTTSTLGRWVASTRWMPTCPGQLGEPHHGVLDVARGDTIIGRTARPRSPAGTGTGDKPARSPAGA